MKLQTLQMIKTPPPPRPPSLQLAIPGNMAYHRRIWHYGGVFKLMVAFLFCLGIVATCEPCSVSGVHHQVENEACRLCRDGGKSDYQGVFTGDVGSGFALDKLEPHASLDYVCGNSNLFCFWSTLPGLSRPGHVVQSTSAEVSGVQSDVKLHEMPNHARTNISWSSNCGIIKFSSGRTISCSLNQQYGCRELPSPPLDSSEGNDVLSCRGSFLDHKSQFFDSKEDARMSDSSSPHVEISPPLLDWGERNLYFPSLAFLTVTNAHSDNILTIYEPYSTNSQFYPCNFSEMVVAPGEGALICFVFLPKWLGFSSAQLVLQTSFGGFFIQATGFALESPYLVQPLIDLDVSSSGKWRKNLSLFNPFNEALYVEELTAWISVSSGNTSHSTKAVCSINSIQDLHELSLLSVHEWIDVRSAEVGLPLVSMRPHKNWVVDPHRMETIMELDFSFPAEGRIFGAFCLQLLRSSKDEIDTLIVPLEAEFGQISAYHEHGSPISVSLKALVPCDSSGTTVAILSVKNDSPCMLSIVNISEVGEGTKYFHIKYTEGLILFPGTVTHVALVLCTSISFEILGPPSELADTNVNCELHVLTNDSRNSEIKIPCRDLVSVCSSHTLDSSVGSPQGSEEVEYESIRTISSGSPKQPLTLNEALNTAEADEIVLKNWKSHATASGMSVLDDDEVLFPLVQVGSHSSRSVNVKNPSQQPVVMQLILHSGKIITECKAADGHFQPSSPGSSTGYKSASPLKYGFSVAEGALTEALVHPYGRASLGPILFQPSDRCGWRSSLLIRNNLSGVEWLPLRGFGGSFSAVLLEESEPVQAVEFKLSLPLPRTISSPDFLHHIDDNMRTCSQPLAKELYAKNMGDLPLEVRSIKVTGTECGLDGFVVQNCKGFVLEPGKSIKLIITFQTDFSAATVQRDLELSLATGIIVIPMKASLPVYMLSFCKKTIFWMRLKKSIVLLLAAFILSLVLFCFIPHLMTFGQDYMFKSGKSFIATVSQAGKSARPHRSHRSCSKLPLSGKMNGLLRSVGKEESLLLEPVGMHNDGFVTKEQVSSFAARPVKSALEFDKKSSCCLDNGKEMTPSSSMTNAVTGQSSDVQDASQAGNLTVKTGKDKGRRRRKKKSSGNGVTGLFEVSSSQSGNSTPSSPLSPVSSLTPTRSRPLSPDMNQSVQARNPFAPVAIQRYPDPKPRAKVLQSEISLKPRGENNYAWSTSSQEKPDVLHKVPGKPVLLPSATLPQAGRPDSLSSCRPSFLSSASTIAPHARAPGSKLNEQKTVEEKAKLKEKFTYDIWGDHIFVDRSKEISGMQPHAEQNNSDSFFVRGPQALVTIAQRESDGSINTFLVLVFDP
ncbi:uncharacterized protein [Coffea arabica]|uniref:Uncharacterized protein isoform X1 n=2 Tax=Coffea arabica TaxID=13443 RepID=A0ABM4V699_COFAR|nr:uncharacterized protein LOC113701781 isoform X1 [Coffea arabica]